MKNFFKIFCLLVLPATAMAEPSPRSCANDPKSQIFEEYESLSDESIAERCTYDIEKHEPDVDERRIKANIRRTSICEKGLTKMRDISRRYTSKKKEICFKAQNAPTCADATSQTSCVVDAANLAAEVKKGEEELGTIMSEGKDKLSSISRFNRLLTSQFKSQQRELGLLPPEQKNKRIPKPDRTNNLPQDIKPTPFRAERSIVDVPGTPSISKPEQAPSAPPRTSGISDSPPNYPPPSEIRPEDYGARTLAEYERKLPFLIQQNETVTKQLQKFEEARVVKQGEHRVAASEMATRASQFYATAEKLGYAGEELIEWKKENPGLVESMAAQEAPPADHLAHAPIGEKPDHEPEAPRAISPLAEKVKESVEEKSSETSQETASAAEPEPKEDQALSSFESKLSDDAKSPAAIAERSRLRDILRRRMQAIQNGQPTENLERVPGSLVGDILAETQAIMGRAPDSETEREREIGPVDVEGALRDIEAQLRELDRQAGILESESLSLFDRVKSQLKKKQKAWAK